MVVAVTVAVVVMRVVRALSFGNLTPDPGWGLPRWATTYTPGLLGQAGGLATSHPAARPPLSLLQPEGSSSHRRAGLCPRGRWGC